MEERTATTDELQCQICGDRAFRKYVGVVVCASCKMFFKRNAEAGTKTATLCSFDGHCDINVLNRHACRSCRLKKCFDCGMQSDLLRSSQPKMDRVTPKKRMTTDTQQVSTLNLLRADQSTLSVEQWNLLSNLIHCYDEHTGFSVAARFVQKQNTLPVKARFKMDAIGDLCASLMQGARLLFEKNADFSVLNVHDRSLLLHSKLKYVGCYGGCFILNTLNVFDDSAFYHKAELVYGSLALASSRRTGHRLDPDITLMKLVLSIILFSTMDYVTCPNATLKNFVDVKAVLRIQDAYVELAWRYVLYKYGFSQAVVRFCNLLRSIFALNDAIVGSIVRDEFANIVDSLIQQTEETLSLND